MIEYLKDIERVVENNAKYGKVSTTVSLSKYDGRVTSMTADLARAYKHNANMEGLTHEEYIQALLEANKLNNFKGSISFTVTFDGKGNITKVMDFGQEQVNYV